MKEKIIRNFWYLTGISLLFIIIALLGLAGVESAYHTLDKEVDSAGAAIIFLFPAYIIEGIAIAIIDVFACRFTIFTSIIIFVYALTARFLISPENGHFTGYKILMGLGYASSMVVAVSWALIVSCLVFPAGIIAAIVGMVFLIRFCSGCCKLTFSEISSDKLSYCTDIPYRINEAAVLCDLNMTVHTVNLSAEEYYKTYSSSEIKGKSMYDFLSSDASEKLRRNSELLKEHYELERFIISSDETDNSKVTVNAVRYKNKTLIGFLIKHE